jgi:nucleoside-diphosphate-sugar epimerase
MPPTAQSTRTALIIGATGGIGGAVARALAARGFVVRALHRDPARAVEAGAAAADVPARWIKGDAMREADVIAAAAGAALIFHGANPPGYVRWRELAIPMLRSSIAAAQASGARLIFPANVYNFGPDAGAFIDEHAPQHSKTRKGVVRVEMERMLAEGAEHGARALVIRAGDFIGAAAGSWFRAAMIKPGAGKPVRSVTYPGAREVGHAWAYLPDLAETIARLSEIEHPLPAFEVFHFGGHWIEPGVEIAHAVRRVVKDPRLPIRRFPWPLIYLGAPFVPFLRELAEMRYLWQVPLRLDNKKLVARLGAEPHTPLDDAVRATLQAMACL